MKYTIQDGANVCIHIEPRLAEIGVHAAIGGSLAYRGHSNKDIDIILYPHSREVVMDRLRIVDELGKLGFVARDSAYMKPGAHITGVPDVYPATGSNGDFVDFFFMQRADIATKEGAQ